MASSKSWVTIIIVFPLEFNFLKILKTSEQVLLSNEPVGSSASSISGLFTIALAIATLCDCPPDSVEGVVVSLSWMPRSKLTWFSNFKCTFC